MAIGQKEARLEELRVARDLFNFYAGQIDLLVVDLKPLLTRVVGDDFGTCHDPLKQLEELLSLAARAERGEVVPLLDQEIQQLNRRVGEIKALVIEVNKKIDGIDEVIAKLEMLVTEKTL